MLTHRTHWRRSLAVLLAVLAIGAAAGLTVAGSQRAAQAQAPDVAGLPRTITVVGEGTVTLQPDIATAQIGVDVSGPTARGQRRGRPHHGGDPGHVGSPRRGVQGHPDLELQHLR